MWGQSPSHNLSLELILPVTIPKNLLNEVGGGTKAGDSSNNGMKGKRWGHQGKHGGQDSSYKA